jgi:ankyrin repeat protein
MGASVNYHAPDIFESSAAVMDRQIEGDVLLRVGNEEMKRTNDRLLALVTDGDLAGVSSMVAEGVAIARCVGLRGYTPLHHACTRGHMGIVALFLKNGADPNARNHSGETTLHLAVYAGRLLVVEQLLDCGARVDEANNDGETALFLAARKGQPALVRLLLQRGADPNWKDSLGDTAREQAADQRTLLELDGPQV